MLAQPVAAREVQLEASWKAALANEF